MHMNVHAHMCVRTCTHTHTHIYIYICKNKELKHEIYDILCMRKITKYRQVLFYTGVMFLKNVMQIEIM
jgi:peptidoglycan/xylan/chitin deacetylase (PgdA/CDA1 family)